MRTASQSVDIWEELRDLILIISRDVGSRGRYTEASRSVDSREVEDGIGEYSPPGRLLSCGVRSDGR